MTPARPMSRKSANDRPQRLRQRAQVLHRFHQPLVDVRTYPCLQVVRRSARRKDEIMWANE
jgi:hypothetical protein